MNKAVPQNHSPREKERIRLAGGEAILELSGHLTSLMDEDERPIFRNVLEKILANVFVTDNSRGMRARFNQAFQEVLQEQSKDIDLKVEMIKAMSLGMEEREKILESSGPYLSLEEAGKALGVTKQAAHSKIAKGTLLGIKIKDEWRLPAWQLRDGEIIGGLAEVLNVLNGETALAKLGFFETPNIYLGEQTPKEVLLQGQVDAVLKAALAFGEQGAR